MLSDIEEDKVQNLKDYSLKISFKLNKENIKQLNNLSKKEQTNLRNEIEALIRDKYIV
jgi:hypothetical protein